MNHKGRAVTFGLVLILLLASIQCSVISMATPAPTPPPGPTPGTWSGEGITFVVSEDRASITYMEVAVSYGGMANVQWVHDPIPIVNNRFTFSRSGNSFLGIPSFDIEGEFTAENAASGTVNGVSSWSAKPGEP